MTTKPHAAAEKIWTAWCDSPAADHLLNEIRQAFWRAIEKDPEPFRPLWNYCQTKAVGWEDTHGEDWADDDLWWDHRPLKDFPQTPEEVPAYASRAAWASTSSFKVSSVEAFTRATEFYRLIAATLHRVWPPICAENPGLEELIPAPSPRHRWQYLGYCFRDFIFEGGWDCMSPAKPFPLCLLA